MWQCKQLHRDCTHVEYVNAQPRSAAGVVALAVAIASSAPPSTNSKNRPQNRKYDEISRRKAASFSSYHVKMYSSPAMIKRPSASAPKIFKFEILH
jgi:hypothetical protein